MDELKYNGQAEQDKFVCHILNNKVNGFFVEIGSHHPIVINNTYFLEMGLNWSGLMFELEERKFKNLYEQYRLNSNYIFGDAQVHDYISIFKKYKVPKIIDFLQLDIDPPVKTMNLLKNLNSGVLNDYKFAIITFEHDYYRKQNNTPRIVSRKILNEKGYYLVFEDIAHKDPNRPYEDWYVHPDLVDMNYVKALQSYNLNNYKPSIGDVKKALHWKDICYLE